MNKKKITKRNKMLYNIKYKSFQRTISRFFLYLSLNKVFKLLSRRL